MVLQHWRRLASFAEACVTTEAWRTNRQTDKKLNVFGHPGGVWNPSPTKLGMVIRVVKLPVIYVGGKLPVTYR